MQDSISFYAKMSPQHSVKSIQGSDCQLHFCVLRQDLLRKSPDQGQSCCTSRCISAIVRVCSKEVLGAAGCRCQQRIFSFFPTNRDPALQELQRKTCSQETIKPETQFLRDQSVTEVLMHGVHQQGIQRDPWLQFL